MMVFFDINILIYAFCKNLDNKEQQDISLRLFDEAIENQNLIVSELILCEFAFISNKLKYKCQATFKLSTKTFSQRRRESYFRCFFFCH